MKTMRFTNKNEKFYKNLKNLMQKIDQQNEDKIVCEKIIKNCKVCNDKENKYKCPKCKIEYCGVECYKKHSIVCTEDFYKRNVLEEMKSQKVDDFEAKNFRKNLKDYHDKINNTCNNSDDVFISEEREKYLNNLLDKIDSGVLDFSKDLSPYDWSEFDKFLNGFYQNDPDFFKESGLELWKPFWECKVNDLEPSIKIFDLSIFNMDEDSLKLLKDLEINEIITFPFSNNEEIKIEDLENFNEQNYIKLNNKFVPINREIIYKAILLKFSYIPNLKKLSKTTPDFSNVYTLTNISLYLVFLFRLYNGEVNQNLEEICNFLFSNCKILYEKLTFETSRLAINDFLISMRKLGDKFYEETQRMVLNDLKIILSNQFYLVEIFIRLYELIHRMNKINLDKNIKRNLILAKHKIIYFLSYTKDLQEGSLEKCFEEVCEYIRERQKHL